jgi:hypothetical protein
LRRKHANTHVTEEENDLNAEVGSFPILTLNPLLEPLKHLIREVLINKNPKMTKAYIKRRKDLSESPVFEMRF